mmetsp:Transcript_30393/g.51197  ORF Transcript_30393/g.51197 Transcript_30393/m.51197 type:complete len:248 (+) Transcript_30393:611-1354(+)
MVYMVELHFFVSSFPAGRPNWPVAHWSEDNSGARPVTCTAGPLVVRLIKPAVAAEGSSSATGVGRLASSLFLASLLDPSWLFLGSCLGFSFLGSFAGLGEAAAGEAGAAGPFPATTVCRLVVAAKSTYSGVRPTANKNLSKSAGVMQVVAVLMKGWNISLGQSLNLTSSSSRTLMAEGFMTANGVTHPGSTCKASVILVPSARRTGVDLGTPRRSDISLRPVAVSFSAQIRYMLPFLSRRHKFFACP